MCRRRTEIHAVWACAEACGNGQTEAQDTEDTEDGELIALALLRPWAALALPLAAFMLAVLLWAIVPLPTLQALLAEDGLIERPTAWLYFGVALLALVWRGRGDPWSDTLAIALLMVAFGAREMDLHKSLAGTSVLRVSYYFGAAPLAHKAVSLVAVAATLWSMAWLAWRHARDVVPGVRRGDPVNISVAVFVVTLILTKLLDRTVGVLTEDFGLAIPASLAALVVDLEEVGELALPAIAMLALWQHRCLRSRAARLDTTPTR